MTNRFFKNQGPFSLHHLCHVLGLNIPTNDMMIKDIAGMETSAPGDLTFFHNPKYASKLSSLNAAACLIHPSYVSHLNACVIPIPSPTPYRDYAKLAKLFYPDITCATIHETAVIATSATIGNHVSIGAYCVVGDGVHIADGTVIESHVTITHTIMGKNCYIKAGARLGQRGFGFHMDERGPFDVPQLGSLIMGDDIVVGSNTTIDRGSGDNTVIESGVRIDNLVQIAHNVRVGKNSILVAQSGVAGSTELGQFVVVAGQVGIAGHLKIGDFVQIAAQSGVARDIDANQKVGGYPAVPIRQWHKQAIVLSNLTKQGKGN